MSNNKQSSVGYLLENLHLKDSLKWAEVIEQAKAMHKEEIEDAHLEGQCDETEGYPLEIAKKFYEQTYGGNKQECQFEIDNSTSSATKCKFCNKEKWQHPNL